MEELLAEVRKRFGNTDVSQYKDCLAVQVNIKNEDPGVFYVEIKDGKLSIEPYEYKDRNAAITISKENFIKLMDHKLDPAAAFMLGKLKVEGDIGKALELTKLM